MSTYDIDYYFGFEDGTERHYCLQLDSDSLQLISDPVSGIKPWMALDFEQCPNCPLDVEQTPYCPATMHLEGLIEDCSNLPSFDDVSLKVVTSERTITADSTMQRALSSLLGLILATSGCPHTRYFRPMARFHLPLASEEETIYRSASMYMLAQYFRTNAGLSADLQLDGLAEIYKNLQQVNKALAARLKSASENDSAVNAVILLDLLAKALPGSITDSLEVIRYGFFAYVEDTQD